MLKRLQKVLLTQFLYILWTDILPLSLPPNVDWGVVGYLRVQGRRLTNTIMLTTELIIK